MIARWHDWVASGQRLRLFSHDIFVRAAGTGSPLLFLHGFPTSSFDFAAIAPALETKHRCIYFDFLGFGASDKPALHYDYELQTNIAIAVAQAHGVERATVVAHDYGVTVGQELLARDVEGRVPFALGAMVFLNGGLCAALHRPIPVQKLFASPAGPLAARVLTSKPMFARSMRKIIRRMDRFDIDEHYQTITPRLMPALLGYIAERKLKHERYEGALRDTAVPLAFAWGLEDPVSGAHALEWARTAAPRAQVTALAGVGHYPQLEAPEQVVAAIEAALTRRSAATRCPTGPCTQTRDTSNVARTPDPLRPFRATGPSMIVTRVPRASGHQIATIEAGPREAPAIVFIHGIAQSKQAFARVLAGPLAASVRLIALDLRGHGDSDDPAADEEVTRADLADDVAAVVTGLQLARPWLAGWSFGGVVIGEYLRRFGDDGLGGLLYLAGSVRTGREAAPLFGPVMMNHARGLLAEDAAVYAAAARAFVAESAVVPLAPATIDAMVADMLRVPARVRRPLLAGREDYRAALAATRVPLATIHGALDPVVLPAMSDLVGTCRPDATATWIPGAGHTPWLETPTLFDAAIASVLAR